MTITINGPDGSKFNFPDDATQDEISGAMQQHYGTASQQPDAANPTSFSPPGVDPNDTRFSLDSMDTKAALRGVPILGPALSDRGSAALTTLAHRFSGFGAPTYAENLAQETQARQAYEAAHPVRSQAVQALGGTIALGGVGGAVPGAARVLGMVGPLRQAVPLGALSGTVIGAADAAARGEDPTTQAVVGGLSGAGGPLLGRGVGLAYDAARGLMRPAATAPARFINVNGRMVPVAESVITRNPVTSAEEQQLRHVGPGVTLGQQLDEATAREMQGAHADLAAQLDPTGTSTQAHPLDAGATAIDDLVQQEQTRAQSEIQRQLGATQATGQLQTDIGGGVVPPPASAADAGQAASTGIRGLFQQARQATRTAYNAAAAVPASYNPRYLINAGDTIRQALDTLPGNQRVRISPEVTPQAQAALNTIDQEISQLRFTNDAARGQRPITPADMEQVRKQLVIQRRLANNAARTTGNWEDARAVGRVMDAFDAWETTTANRPGGLLTGNPADVIAARQAARAAHAQERATFSRRGPGDAVGTFMENVIGKYPGQEMSPEKIVRTLMGSPDNPGSENAVPILNHLRDNVFGQNSPQWQQIKQGVISHLTQPVPGADPVPFAKQAQRIDRLLANQRLRDALFTPAEQARLQALSGRFRGVADVEPAAGTVDRMIAQLSGRFGQVGSPEQLISQLSGAQGGALARELAGGRISPESLGVLKQGIFARIAEAPSGMIPWQHQRTGQNIAKFLNTSLARNLYSPNELAMMRAIADAHLQIVPIPGTTNYSGSAYTAARMAKGLTRQLLRSVGGIHGGLHGYLVGEGIGTGLEKLSARREAQRAAELFYGGQGPLPPATAPQAVGALAAPLLTQQAAEAQQ